MRGYFIFNIFVSKKFIPPFCKFIIDLAGKFNAYQFPQKYFNVLEVLAQYILVMKKSFFTTPSTSALLLPSFFDSNSLILKTFLLINNELKSHLRANKS
ncbi:TPA: hypothetical protein I2T40_02070 [Staphylococcus aureus]|nr:hypothetical protein [Staphylococcus aureus]